MDNLCHEIVYHKHKELDYSKMICNICNKRFYGPTIKCSSTKCNFRCHPECARANDYYFEMEIYYLYYQHFH